MKISFMKKEICINNNPIERMDMWIERIRKIRFFDDFKIVTNESYKKADFKREI